MLSIGIMPPSAVYESNMPFTAPVEVSVEVEPNSAVPKIPKRCSLPSIAPPASCGAVPFPAASSALTTTSEITNSEAMTARIA